MKMFTVLTLNAAVIVSNAYALEQLPKKELRIVERMARSALQKDIKIETRKVDNGVCGASGPSFIIKVTLRKVSKAVDKDSGQIVLGEKWDVIKSYAVPASKLKSPGNDALMDADACLE
jgi:hypothetical protein